jgi:hypothetical protein
MRNRFFIWTRDAADPRELSDLRIQELRPDAILHESGHTDVRYYIRLAHELDAVFPDQGITFLITWHLDRFEDRFRDAVVILVGDEMHQTPSYAGQVQAIFKTGGARPNPTRHTVRLAPSVAWRVGLRDLRNVLLAQRRQLFKPKGPDPPVFEVPMGYFGLIEVPFIPVADRPVDVFFAGSVESDSGLTLRPRLVARRQMAAALAATRRQQPGLRVDYSSAGPFANPAQMHDPRAYSTRLMQARIVLCPRGNFDETFRVSEAAKFGCVAIAERLPERWYYRDAPVIQIDRWQSLPQILRDALSDPAALAQRSEEMRRWWSTSLSEAAVAQFIASSLSKLPVVQKRAPASG